MTTQTTNRLLTLLLLAATFLAFSPALKSGFLNWDDPDHLNQPFVRDLSPGNLRVILTVPVMKVYCPLTILSFAAEYRLWGYNPIIYHLDNILLHLAATGLVLALGLRMGLRRQGAALAALLFGLHPIHVEAVAWISARKDLLSTVFYLLAMRAYIIYITRADRSAYLWAILLGLLSLLAKPMALSLPLILWACDGYFQRRGALRLLAEKIPFLLYTIPIVGITYAANANGSISPGALPDQALLWLWSLFFYIQKFTWPWPLQPIYTLPRPVAISNPLYLWPLIGTVSLLGIILHLRRQRLVVFCVLTTLGSIFFLLRTNPLTAGVNPVADRYLYLPSLGLCLLAGAALDRALTAAGTHRIKTWARGLSAVFFLGLGLLTFRQNQKWQNGETFWTHVIRYAPGHVDAYYQRAKARIEAGQLDLAQADFQQAARMQTRQQSLPPPGAPAPLLSTAERLFSQSRLDQARAACDAALKTPSNHGPVYALRAKISQAQGRYHDAFLDLLWAQALGETVAMDDLSLIKAHIRTDTR